MTARGEFDAIIAGMTSTAERREVISFTDSYLDAENVVLRLGATAVPTYATLGTKKIGVQAGTVQHEIALRLFDDSRVIDFESADLAERALIAGTVDYVICEDVRAAVAVAIHTTTSLAYTEDITEIHFGANASGNNIGVPKTISTEMMTKLNAGVAAISETQRATMVTTAGALAVYVGRA